MCDPQMDEFQSPTVSTPADHTAIVRDAMPARERYMDDVFRARVEACHSALDELERDAERGSTYREQLRKAEARVEQLRKLVVEHHALGAMDGIEWGGTCPVCKAHPELRAALDGGTAT